MSGMQLFGVVPFEHGMSVRAPGVELIPFRAIAAAAAPVDYRRPSSDDANVARYAETVEAVNADVPILPAPPGTIFKSHGALSRWLELHYVALTDALSAIEGNVAARLTVRLRGEADNDHMTKEWQALAAESLRVFRSHAGSVAAPGAGSDGDDPGVLARASFLIERERWTAFEESVEAERRRHPHLEFKLSGPWPPYDFVRMQFGN